MLEAVIVYERDIFIGKFEFKEYIIRVGKKVYSLNSYGDDDAFDPDTDRSYKPVFYCYLDEPVALCRFLKSFRSYRSIVDDFDDVLTSTLSDIYKNEKDEYNRRMIESYALL